METKEFIFKGMTVNGFLMLILNILITLASIAAIVLSIIYENLWFIYGIIGIILSVFIWCGFIMLEPGEARVITFFGNYKGTFKRTGYYWINPLMSTKKLTLRARNLDAAPIKVNDKTGNPVMIGMVIVWKLKDTYKAIFEIDSQTIAKTNVAGKEEVIIGASTSGLMSAFENFVKIQGDSALRQVASQYAYDETDLKSDEITLRSGGDEINRELEAKLQERLLMAGIEIVEARINYLAYAPEIAAVMLRRQQATAIITAREKIVEGAVSMVKMALDKLSDEEIVELDDDKKAAMVSNLLVVLCGDDNAQPVVNTGTLNH
ncbi:MAG: SPFH domain-containing protein [Prevotella sp.]|nr:SPFH domain-containing protein [Prevotella sp.]